jgi:penicillin-binding protein 1C
VGNFDRTPLRNSSGVTGAAPIFQAVMVAAERRLGGSAAGFPHDPILPAPATTVQREVCALSGLVAHESCPLRRREWVAAEAASSPCTWHHESEHGVLTFWPPEYRQWAQAEGLDNPARTGAVGGRISAVSRTSHAAGGADHARPPLEIVSPPSGATYLIDPTLRREFQTLPLRVVAVTPGRIEWSVDGHAVGSADADSVLDWPLEPGRHRIAARDRHGHTAETTVTVR